MNAVLKIEARAITAPAYDNTNVSRQGWWVADNISKLRDYWHAFGPGGDSKDWDSFCYTQWDRETTRKQDNRNTLRQY